VLTGNDCRRELNLPALPDGDTLTSPYTTAGKQPEASNDNQKPDKEASRVSDRHQSRRDLRDRHKG
jgi:hypothetical protein